MRHDLNIRICVRRLVGMLVGELEISLEHRFVAKTRIRDDAVDMHEKVRETSGEIGKEAIR